MSEGLLDSPPVIPRGDDRGKCPTVRILPDSVHYVTDEYVWRAFTTRSEMTFCGGAIKAPRR